jgi:hypothetical protein
VFLPVKKESKLKFKKLQFGKVSEVGREEKEEQVLARESRMSNRYTLVTGGG